MISRGALEFSRQLATVSFEALWIANFIVILLHLDLAESSDLVLKIGYGLICTAAGLVIVSVILLRELPHLCKNSEEGALRTVLLYKAVTVLATIALFIDIAGLDILVEHGLITNIMLQLAVTLGVTSVISLVAYFTLTLFRNRAIRTVKDV